MKLSVRTESLRTVREAHQVPGVMYGKEISPVNVQVDEKEFKEALKKYGKSMTFKAELDGVTHDVYIKYTQGRILLPETIIHFDLHRVSAKEMFETTIPIQLVGKEAFHGQSYLLLQELDMLEVEFAPGQGLSKIEIDVSKLKVGESLRVKDLNLGHGIVILEDMEQVIAHVKEQTISEEEPVVAAPVVAPVVEEKIVETVEQKRNKK
ncbi:MAG: 50S ribosomal protein L25 [Acholeplasmataceae bacterium]|nr:50S ribosomal protein L25 [Acholeplasmataceae bacterium]